MSHQRRLRSVCHQNTNSHTEPGVAISVCIWQQKFPIDAHFPNKMESSALKLVFRWHPGVHGSCMHCHTVDGPPRATSPYHSWSPRIIHRASPQDKPPAMQTLESNPAIQTLETNRALLTILIYPKPRAPNPGAQLPWTVRGPLWRLICFCRNRAAFKMLLYLIGPFAYPRLSRQHPLSPPGGVS